MTTHKHLHQIQHIHDEAVRELSFWEEQDAVGMFDLSKSHRCRDLWRQIQKTERMLNPKGKKQ